MEIAKISAQEAHTIIVQNNNFIFIDVRSEAEFVRGHARGFVNIPLDEIASDMKRIHSAECVYFMCHSGGRSFLATKLVVERGINAVNIEGGFSAWKAAGLPVE